MDGRQPNPRGESLSPRGKRVFATVAVAIAMMLGATAVWAMLASGSYGRSGHGCVVVTMPSTTGGAILHGCGATARAMCHRAFSHTDRVALLTRPQCRLAGITAASPTRSP